MFGLHSLGYDANFLLPVSVDMDVDSSPPKSDAVHDVNVSHVLDLEAEVSDDDDDDQDSANGSSEGDSGDDAVAEVSPLIKKPLDPSADLYDLADEFMSVSAAF